MRYKSQDLKAKAVREAAHRQPINFSTLTKTFINKKKIVKPFKYEASHAR